MRALVVYESRYGNTGKVAGAITAGLEQAGVIAKCVTPQDGAAATLADYDLICVGAPTEIFSASKPMKEFLSRVKGTDLRGRLTFAFDTKVEWRFSGSAARYIEKELAHMGGTQASGHESALVTTERGEGGIVGAKLLEGEEKRFQQVGYRLGRIIMTEPPVIG
jgi:flavodoxin